MLVKVKCSCLSLIDQIQHVSVITCVRLYLSPLLIKAHVQTLTCHDVLARCSKSSFIRSDKMCMKHFKHTKLTLASMYLLPHMNDEHNSEHTTDLCRLHY